MEDTSLFPPRLLSGALDDNTFPTLDNLIEYFAPEGPYLTFGAPEVARTLASYGRTVLAHRAFGGDPLLDDRIPEVEVRIAGPRDPMVFPPGRFGLVHARWIPTDSVTLSNLIRWLRPGGVLLVEAPDAYPVQALPKGPRRSVTQAIIERMNLPGALDLPARLMQQGLRYVGCKHEAPIGDGIQALLEHLLRLGSPWPEIAEEDHRDWIGDEAARHTPALMNILAWGMRPS
ncbi:hypothetical protein ACFW2V_13115 [Streptomyces sp. NPDC058947]|uniref:hypothetical protein n=1 Tax=Streptomyces sp. NPDC058947 TaxID=3346675 RepID=UPI0036A5EBA4